MRKNKGQPVIFLGLIIAIILLIFLIRAVFFSPKHQAEKAVEEFYSYEQEGNFTDSWELFHPYMKERWDKSTYINDRAHVFMGHFGAETFDFSIEYIDEASGWKMSKDKKPFKTAYKFQVVQMYKGKYGTFNFVQEVYVVQNKGEWGILWDYNN